ncbi:MAG: prolipoprotein diacylglyceryl transferase [Phycisphaerae bacterium]|nr:prolipoprotein diacylglyceryl transferase [Phycisphaerae bacterium]
MYPTMFRLPFLPESWADIKSYGVMMTIAFLGGIWIAARRAIRVQADPDVVLNMGFIALLAGVVGARLMFVIHYWEERFANQPNPLMSVIDIRAGGLEFWGGPILVIPALLVYLKWTKQSLRWYLDITAPSLMFGLAMARIGCFLNGCCWGSICVDEHDPARQAKGLPWAVVYPYGSPAMAQQFMFGQMTLPKELQYYLPSGHTFPLPREMVEATREELDGASRDLRDAEDELRNAETRGFEASQIEKLKTKVAQARQRVERTRAKYAPLYRNCQTYGLLPSEIRDIASHYGSRPAHPTQLYAFITGMLLYWLLDRMFYRRQRHGVVLPWLLVLYSVARVLEESIRQDNPLDVGGVTISQAVSIVMFITGVWALLSLRRRPLKCPLAVRFEPPPEARPASCDVSSS